MAANDDERQETASALATPTDIEDAASPVGEALNGLLADTFALYVKTKNFHWHMSGPHFRDYHLLLDEQATEILATVDELAERVRKIGGTTIRSIGHIAKLTRVADEDRPFVPAQEMLQILLADNRSFVENIRDAHDVCDDHEDIASASLLEEFIDQAERRTWFLFETTRSDADMVGAKGRR